MNYQTWARNKGWTKVTLTTERRNVYASNQPGSYQEKTRTAFVSDLGADYQTSVTWGNVMGSLTRNSEGQWSSINTQRASFIVHSIEIVG